MCLTSVSRSLTSEAKQTICLLLCCTTLVYSPFALANEFTATQIINQASKVLLILSFDRNLAKRQASKPVTIGILHKEGSADFADRLKGALENKDTARLLPQPLHVEKVLYENPNALRKTLKNKNYSALFISRDLANSISSITQLSRALKIPTFSNTSLFSERGIAVSVVALEESTQLVINLRAARAEGMDLPSSVLIIAKLVG